MDVEFGEIVFPRVGQVAYEARSATFHLGPDDVLIRTLYSVVSAGTELAKLTGLQKVSYPFVPGNRAVGEVVAIGSAVTDVGVGTRIFCHTPHANYAIAKGLRLPVLDGVDLSASPLVGLAMVGMTALRVGQVELGDRVAVIGLGLVGQLAAQLLQAAGAEVLGIDTVATRRRIARDWGLTQLVDASQPNVREAVLELTGGRGVDLVVEASGNPRAAELAASLTGLKGEGVVVLLGSPRADYEANLTPFLNRIHLWHNGAVTLRGAHEWRYPLTQTPFQKHSMQRNGEIIFRLMAQGKLKTQPLISRIVPPSEAESAFDDLRQRPESCLSVVFDWTDEGLARR